MSTRNQIINAIIYSITEEPETILKEVLEDFYGADYDNFDDREFEFEKIMKTLVKDIRKLKE